MTYPTVTVIIPRRANDSAEAAIQAVLNSDYPQHLVEIIEPIGESPSKQRNMGAAAAHGEVLYFLDNDSIVTPTLFSRIVKYYAGAQGLSGDPGAQSALGESGVQSTLCNGGQSSLCESFDRQEKLAGVGGPNLTPPTDGFLQKTFGYALASPFAHFKMCARYKSTGNLRYAGEKELILCNLSIRKKTFLQEHGFDESMYPNEENEFINRLVEKGYRFIYDPDAYIYRSRRNQFWGFIRQLFHYGSGRADQILVEGLSPQSLLFFLPLGLLCYLASLVFLLAVSDLSWWMTLPLAFYGVLAILSALQFAIQEYIPVLVVILPIWYVLMHLSYGAGLLWGFLKTWDFLQAKQEKSSAPVEIVVRKRLE
jgi:succinoglycan biosynthesis protein ExoA